MGGDVLYCTRTLVLHEFSLHCHEFSWAKILAKFFRPRCTTTRWVLLALEIKSILCTTTGPSRVCMWCVQGVCVLHRVVSKVQLSKMQCPLEIQLRVAKFRKRLFERVCTVFHLLQPGAAALCSPSSTALCSTLTPLHTSEHTDEQLLVPSLPMSEF